MRGDSAQLPVDFLVGFTIFILSLIMAANFVPSLLVGLQRTSGIDYDAVAYRTGVVLVEDPGEPAGNRIVGEVSDREPWHLKTKYYKAEIDRLGLALTADTPNILSINKINRFFCTTETSAPTLFFDDRFDSSSNDYRTKLLFSEYMYGYNITLRNLSPMKPGESLLNLSIGQPYPAGYGYIRRYVLIKQNTNATLNMNVTNYGLSTLPFDAYSDSQVKNAQGEEEFRIRLDGPILYNKSIDAPYTIDLLMEPFTVRITNISSVLNSSELNPSPLAKNATEWNWNQCGDTTSPAITGATLKAVRFYDSLGGEIAGYYASMMLTIDGIPKPGPGLSLDPSPLNGGVGYKVKDTIELSVSPLWPSGTNEFDKYKSLEIGLVFDDRDSCPGGGNPLPRILVTGTFLYDYQNVTRPDLSTGMLEVGIW
jgi:hypothetical protein